MNMEYSVLVNTNILAFGQRRRFLIFIIECDWHTPWSKTLWQPYKVDQPHGQLVAVFDKCKKLCTRVLQSDMWWVHYNRKSPLLTDVGSLIQICTCFDPYCIPQTLHSLEHPLDPYIVVNLPKAHDVGWVLLYHTNLMLLICQSFYLQLPV